MAVVLPVLCRTGGGVGSCSSKNVLALLTNFSGASTTAHRVQVQRQHLPRSVSSCALLPSAAALRALAMRTAALVILSACSVILAAGGLVLAEPIDSSPPEYTHVWAVHVPGGAAAADVVASELGFINHGQIGSLDNHFHFWQNCTADLPCIPRHQRSSPHHTRLNRHRHVEWAEQQRVVHRVRRSIVPREPLSFEDPLFKQQWFLEQPNGHDINVRKVWEEYGFTGKGVVVTVVDDGIEHSHPDLHDNYDPLASTDLNGHDSDPFPRESDPINKHGTRCCGEIAAAKNSACGVGIAFDASIGAVRMLDGDVNDAVEAGSLGLAPNHIDIYSSSWGPNDDGRTVEEPGPLTKQALLNGVTNGRNGKGSIYVFANGNGGRYGDNCNADGYSNSIYTIAIGAISERDQNPWYAEQCSATVAVTYSSGTGGDRAITTVDLHNRCTSQHTGTSAAAPVAAGIYALVLQANPSLTWRDLQHVTVHGAVVVDPTDDSWTTNAAGHRVSHKYGFGKLDTLKLVETALSWTNVGPQLVARSNIVWPALDIPHTNVKGGGAESVIEVSESDLAIRKLEHIEVYVRITAPRRGDIGIELVCPSGTSSILLTPRALDGSAEGWNWTLMTTHCWDEPAVGTYRLLVRSELHPENTAKLDAWSITIYGTENA
eukprot:m.236812 g.236812  ORF g.236812 m.236812 type:complete len:659 (-) comp10902_c0_seq1:74-2050(-)